MSNERKGVEFLVGLFLIIGLGVIASMVVIFGRVGQGIQGNYTIKVHFPNASGLVKGSDVLLSGARIGVVTQAPKLIGERYAVEVGLSIRQEVKVPRKASFQIRSSGMLGDSYVDVSPPKEFDANDFAADGETISGQRTGGIDDLTAKGSQMMDTLNQEVLLKVSQALDEIKAATTSIKVDLLNEKNLKNLEATFENLKVTTAEFSKMTKDLDIVVAKTSEAVESAKITLKTVDNTAGDARLAIGDFRKTADSATMLLDKATKGEGALGTLVGNKQTADDLRSLIANLRRSGVLFYKDRPVAPAEAPTPTPKRR